MVLENCSDNSNIVYWLNLVRAPVNSELQQLKMKNVIWFDNSLLLYIVVHLYVKQLLQSLSIIAIFANVSIVLKSQN